MHHRNWRYWQGSWWVSNSFPVSESFNRLLFGLGFMWQQPEDCRLRNCSCSLSDEAAGIGCANLQKFIPWLFQASGDGAQRRWAWQEKGWNTFGEMNCCTSWSADHESMFTVRRFLLLILARSYRIPTPWIDYQRLEVDADHICNLEETNISRYSVRPSILRVACDVVIGSWSQEFHVSWRNWGLKDWKQHRESLLGGGFNWLFGRMSAPGREYQFPDLHDVHVPSNLSGALVPYVWPMPRTNNPARTVTRAVSPLPCATCVTTVHMVDC